MTLKSECALSLNNGLADISKFYLTIHVKTQNIFWLP